MSNDGWDDFFDAENIEKSQGKEAVVDEVKNDATAQIESIIEPERAIVESKVENQTPDFSYTNQAPSINGEILSQHFTNLILKVREQYERLPKLNYDDVYSELSELTVKACPTPTLQIINQELQKSQSAKDRVTELDIQVTQCLMLKDRAVDILREAWSKFSDEKSADKRKGEGMFILSNFEMDLAKTEALSKACKYVMMNLVSLQDTLSRRITNIQLQIKLMDIGRSALPDFDFSKKSMDIQLDPQDNTFQPETKEDGSILAKEEDF